MELTTQSPHLEDETKLTIKVTTDKSELLNFAMQLNQLATEINPQLYVYTFAKREITNILTKIHKKLIVPKKAIKAITFNYYEIQTLIFIEQSSIIDPIKHLEFNMLFHKVNRMV